MRALAVALIATVALTASAEDKKPALPTGTWSHDTEGFEVRFTFNKDELKISAKGGDASVATTCKCEIDKDGVIKVTIGDVKTKGDVPAPKEGQVMSFKFIVDGKKAKLSDFTSKDLDHAKPVLEGDYETKSD